FAIATCIGVQGSQIPRTIGPIRMQLQGAFVEANCILRFAFFPRCSCLPSKLLEAAGSRPWLGCLRRNGLSDHRTRSDQKERDRDHGEHAAIKTWYWHEEHALDEILACEVRCFLHDKISNTL